MSFDWPDSMIVTSFPPFKPFSWLDNNHLQTIAYMLHRSHPSKNPTQRLVVKLDDGDHLVIHDNTPKKWITGDRIVVLLHGLCGSHRSLYMRRVSEKLRQSGFRTIRIDMRGTGDSELISRGHSHGAASGDLRKVVESVHALSPLSPMTLLGFSLGGNIVLRLAGQWGSAYPEYVDSAVAIAPPIDLVQCSANLRHWGNRLYDLFFCSKLRNTLLRRRRLVPGLMDNGLTKLPKRLVHFDDQFVAPVNGFRGARDYYQQASSAPLLQEIALPTIIVAAQDDPIVPARIFKQWVSSPSVEIVYTPKGGHLGYLGQTRGDPDSFWLDWRLVRWIRDHDELLSLRRLSAFPGTVQV